jgi:hypothetical protein
MLAAATSSEPRITVTPGAIRIEVDLPEQLTTATRSTILTTLGAADRYGHDRTADGNSVWAEIDRRTAP